MLPHSRQILPAVRLRCSELHEEAMSMVRRSNFIVIGNNMCSTRSISDMGFPIYHT